MTTYWKSQDRKFCEFCKCWFADNKVSISFHENGKRHKENVKKHISQLSKKSAKDFKKQEKIEDEMKKMEAAAMSAYLKDVRNNADLTSQSINELLGNSGSTSKDIVIPSDAKETPVWQETKSDDGNIYYWNTETNETTWDPPDNFISLAQQEEKKLKEKEEQKREKMLKKQKQKEAIDEVKALMAREKMRELAVDKDEPKPVKADVPFGPAPCVRPYGTWKPVVKEPEQDIDLQLPKSEKETIPPPVVMEPEKIVFKEKRVESLGDGPVEFKKRKFNNHKRNMRQKLDDD
ncbi:WW domain-binding protein 4 isoform X6 [Bicyclus anynana]|uniref:WW domain-binding protein 4 isoform X5 n=1 Tax=Bicyclus anynana TaxID=110368 RepID=A0A6J1MLT6_BICAN|nr:WW domain-binding protein 4 isoform X5 [Bicyclus anynana]XP_052739681.1 WW domain-binding protein 4 isoform X6 [Bicyclus anynana]